MSKLITAKEAFALSKYNENVDKYIERINYTIRDYCNRNRTSAVCFLVGCTDREAIAISARLAAAEYCFNWHRSEIRGDIVFHISWGGH
jgi:hypothetical protein